MLKDQALAICVRADAGILSLRIVRFVTAVMGTLGKLQKNLYNCNISRAKTRTKSGTVFIKDATDLQAVARSFYKENVN